MTDCDAPAARSVGTPLSVETLNMFENELAQLTEVRRKLMEVVLREKSPTAMTIGRQSMDHLDAGALFLQHLALYLAHAEAAVESKVAAQPGLTVVK